MSATGTFHPLSPPTTAQAHVPAVAGSILPAEPAIELSVVMPCLNEAETLAACIENARAGIARAGISAEIIVADNGSTDGSIQIAEAMGARVVHVAERGYGSALQGGIAGARGRWIVMGDADNSYDFTSIELFVAKLREGNELVMGCRFPSGGGTIVPGAMPWKNRWIGNPSLSFLGRLFFALSARDLHCGLRAFSKDAYRRMELKTTGMEFASEMVIKAALRRMPVAEVPVTLRPDGRSRPPHLRPWRDGWRHLRFMLIYSPRWLFLIPGLLLASVGAVVSTALTLAPLAIGTVWLDVGTLVVACMLLIVGLQLLAFGFFTKVFAVNEGLLPGDARLTRMVATFTVEKGVGLGTLLVAGGGALLLRALWMWGQASFGELHYSENLRRLVPATTLIVTGLQIVFSSFFMGVLALKTSARPPAE